MYKYKYMLDVQIVCQDFRKRIRVKYIKEHCIYNLEHQSGRIRVFLRITSVCLCLALAAQGAWARLVRGTFPPELGLLST